jgi:hypothetical protein
MRVITTQMYFDPSYVHWKLNNPQKNPGVAAAWFRLEDWPDSAELRQNLEMRLKEEGLLVRLTDSSSSLGTFHDLTEIWIQDVQVNEALKLLQRPTFDHLNEHIAKSLLDSEIIFEQSPPAEKKLRELLKKSPGAVIGTFLGYNSVPPDHQLFMWLTIPAGIIVISSALGIGMGLYNGLSHWIEETFRKTKKK